MPEQPYYPQQYAQSHMQRQEPESSSGIGGSLLKGGLFGGGLVAVFAFFGDKIAEYVPFLRPFLEKMGVAKPHTSDAVGAPAPAPAASTTTPQAAPAAGTASPPAASSPKAAGDIITEDKEPSAAAAAGAKKPPVIIDETAEQAGLPAKPAIGVAAAPAASGVAAAPAASGAATPPLIDESADAPDPKPVPDTIRRNWPVNELPTMSGSVVASAMASTSAAGRNKNNLYVPQDIKDNYHGKNYLGKTKASEADFPNMTIAQARKFVQDNKDGQPTAITKRLEFLLSDQHLASLNNLGLKQKVIDQGTWGMRTNEKDLKFSTSTKMKDLPEYAGKKYLSKFLGGDEKVTPGIEEFTLSLTAAEAKRVALQQWQQFGLTPLQAQAWKQTVDQMIVTNLDDNKRPATIRKGADLDLTRSAAPKRTTFTEVYSNENIYQDVTSFLTPEQLVELVKKSTPEKDLTAQLRQVKKPTMNPLDHEPTLLDYKAQILARYEKLTPEQKKMPLKVLSTVDETKQAASFVEIIKTPISATTAVVKKTALNGVTGGEHVAGEVRPTNVAGLDGSQQSDLRVS